MSLYRYYVRTLPEGKQLTCPAYGTLFSLYLTTIHKLTGMEPNQARAMLQAGRKIKTRGCEFWAEDLTNHSLHLVN